MTSLRVWLLASLWVFTAQLQAETVKPFVKGSFSAIQQHYQDQAYLVLFWSQHCVYCMKALTTLSPVLKANPHITLVTVATDPFLDESFIRNKMARFDLAKADHWVFANEYPEILYFDVEKRWRGELPLTYLANGKTVIRKHGLLKEVDIATWLQSF